MSFFKNWLFEFCGEWDIDVFIDDPTGMMYALVGEWLAVYDGETVVVG